MARPGTFTAETARKAAIASVNARRIAAEYLAANPPAVQTIQPLPITVCPTAAPTVALDDFQTRKLARVRGQIERVETLLDDADEPQAVDRFANALTRLYDLERVLAGRPLPGSRRPVADRVDRRAPAGQLAPLSVASQAAIPVAVPAPIPPEQVAPGPARALGWEYDDPDASQTPASDTPVA